MTNQLKLVCGSTERLLVATSWECNNNIERKQLKRCLISLLKTLSTRLSRNKSTTHFAFRVECVGSSEEGTKAFRQDEFDCICYFHDNLKKQAEQFSKLFIKIKCTDESPWQSCITSKHGKLNMRKVALEFYSAVDREIDSMYEEGIHCGKLFLGFKSFEMKDKISCLRLLWKGRSCNNMNIYVDLVPAFQLNDISLEKLLPFASKNKEYHCVAKTSRIEYSDDNKEYFPVSYACEEVAIIKSLPREVRKGYCIAKALRMTTICQPNDTSPLRRTEHIRSDSIITSYMLKTCLINLVSRRTLEKGSLYDWTDRIYEEFEGRWWISQIMYFRRTCVLVPTLSGINWCFACMLSECPHYACPLSPNTKMAARK